MKKTVFFLTIIVFTLISTLCIYVVFNWFYTLIVGSENANGILTKTTVYLFFLKLSGTLALIFIGIAASLGALRNVIFSFYRNQAFWRIHTRWASSIGVGLACAHLTIYLLYEWKLKVPITLKLFTPVSFSTTVNSNLIFIGLFALCLFTLNLIVTNIPGVTGKIWWRPLHILNYLGFFLVLIHAYYNGSDSKEYIFIALYLLLLILALSGSIARFFAFSNKLMSPKKAIAPTAVASVKTPVSAPSTSPMPTQTIAVSTPKPLPQPNSFLWFKEKRDSIFCCNFFS